MTWRHRVFPSDDPTVTDPAGKLVDTEATVIGAGPFLIRIRDDEGREWEAPIRELAAEPGSF